MAEEQVKQKTEKKENYELSLSNEFIERLILKKFLSDPSYANFITENADPDCFSNNAIKSAIGICIAYHKKGYKTPLTLDLLTQIMSATLKGESRKTDVELISSYVNITPVDEEIAKEEIRKFIQGKKLFRLVFEHSAELMKAKNFSSVISGMNDIASIEFETDLGFNYLKDTQKHIDYLLNPEYKMSVGFSELDRIMNGGLPTGGKCLLVLMAQAGLGKSMMMHNMAANMVREGKKVLIVSLEMTEQIYAARFSANFTECNINELAIDDNVSKIISVVDSINAEHPDAGLIIKEFPPSSLRSIALANYIDKLIMSGWKPDIVFVDYLNIMIPNVSERGDNSYVKVGEICKELRALSYRYEVPFVTATQTNRDGMDNSEPSMKNISESSQTAHHTDGLFAMSADTENLGIIKLSVLKNRFGGKVGSTVRFQMDPNNLILTQMQGLTAEEESNLERITDEMDEMNPNS